MAIVLLTRTCCAYLMLIGFTEGVICYRCDSFSSDFSNFETPLDGRCDKPGVNTATTECNGVCQSVFQSDGVSRDCTEITCTEGTDSERDTTCCTGDKCNNQGPKGIGWHACYKCVGINDDVSCSDEGFIGRDDMNYGYCQGQCMKMTTEISVFGFKSKSTTRRCDSNCVPGKSSGDLWGISLGNTEVFCCDQHECNTGASVTGLNILYTGIIMVTLRYL